MENENEKIHQSDIPTTGGIQRTTPTTRTTGSSANGKSKMLSNNNNNYNNNDNNNNNNRNCKYSSKRRKVKTNIISRKTKNKSKTPKHYSSSLKTQFQVIFLYSFLSYFHQTIFALTFFSVSVWRSN